MNNNQQNPTFYDQLANDDLIQTDQFQQELKDIRAGIDKDLGLQESSGLVNPLGLKERSEYAPNFGKGYADQKPVQDRREQRVGYLGGYNPTSLEDTDKFKSSKLRSDKESSEEMTLDMLGSKSDNQRPLRRDISEGDYVNLGDDLPQNKNMQQARVPSSAQGILQYSDPSSKSVDKNTGGPEMQGAPFAAEDFSLDQFKENNAQLQAILMQLQTTPQFNANTATGQATTKTQMNVNSKPQMSAAGQYSGNASGKQQLSSAPTGESGVQVQRSDRSKYAGTQGTNGNHEVSQFSYVSREEASLGSLTQNMTGNLAGGEFHGSTANMYKNNPTSCQQINSQTREPPHFNAPASQPFGVGEIASNQNRNRSPLAMELPSEISKIEMLQQAIASQQQIAQPKSSTSPNVGAGNYRNVFKPNQAFMNAGQQMLEQKENYSYRGNQEATHIPQFQMNIHDHHTQQSLQQSQFSQQISNRPSLGAVSNKFDNPMFNQAHASTQQSLAGEFTLQPRQPGEHEEKSTPRQHASRAENKTDVVEAHKEIMKNFDDIPISKIQKLHGYQTGPEMYQAGAPQPKEDPNIDEEPDDEADSSLPIAERVHNAKWKVRLEAYKEINQSFQIDYAQFLKSKNNPDTKNGDQSLLYAFDVHGSLLSQMIQDTNLIAAYEALQCLYTYVKYAVDIKAVAFACHNYLLEKVQTNKPNFKEITNKILLTVIGRGQAPLIFPELLKRFQSKQIRITIFTMHVVDEAFKSDTAIDDINLKTVFRKIQENLSHQNKEARDLSVSILQHVYKNCGDDVSTFLSHCKKLRPVQQKELKTLLDELDKHPRASNQMLFDGDDLDSGNVREVKETEAAERQKSVGRATAFEVPQRDTNEQSQPVNDPVDLLTLIPENFQEIPYTPSINTKKKAMEAFNQELAKLVQQQLKYTQSIVKVKDYAMIFNTAVHMLEDKNMLVFLEAIKTVELLANLLGRDNSLKPIKVKTFINLMAGKYSETKPAVISAVDKAMAAIVKHSYPANQFADLCINQIAFTHKNPRVKQFVLDHAIDQFIRSIPKEQVAQIFKVVKEKLIQIVLKDTHATVRDASVYLLITFRTHMNQADVAQFQEAIKVLPKYRVSEIDKKVNEIISPCVENPSGTAPMNKTMVDKTSAKITISNDQNSIDVNEDRSVDGTQQNKPKFANSFTERIRSAKGQHTQPDVAKPDNFQNDLLKGRQISEEFKPLIISILTDLGHMKRNEFTQVSKGQELDAKWDTILRQLGEAGIRQAKPIFVNAVYQVVTTPKIQLFENHQHLKCMLSFAKRLYTIERSIEREDDGTPGQELTQFVKIALLQNVWIAGNQGETCQMLQVSLHATNDVFEYTERLRDIVEQPVILQCPAALQIIEAVYVWLGIRLNEFMSKGMEISDLEELRGFGLKYLDNAGFTEAQRQALVGIMIKFKDLVQHKRNEIEQFLRQQEPTKPVEDVELPSQSSMSRLATPQDEEQQNLQSSRMTQPMTAAFGESVQQQESYRSNASDELTADHICKVIDTEFERGLLLFKDMAQQTVLEFSAKEQIFNKLLSIVNESHNQSQQQQVKQAYALKALMWMKEETLGVEDCFRLTQRIMSVYARSEVEEADPTVELYLLNFWTKSLSIRDLADRIALCVINSDGKDPAAETGYSITLVQSANKRQLEIFNALLKWFAQKRLFPDEAEAESSQAATHDEWMVTDLRKIIFYLTMSVLDKSLPTAEYARSLVRNCVAKFGTEKVKEFMEIQLMHQNELSLKLLDWFDKEFDIPRKAGTQQVSIPKMSIEQLSGKKTEADPSRISSAVNSTRDKQQTPRGLVGASQSYKERREQRKSSTQKLRANGDEHQDQYKDIISRIESNLQEVHHGQNSHRKIDETSGESGDEKFGRNDELEESKDYASKNQNEDPERPMRRTQTSAYYRSIEKKRARYTPSAEELADDQDIKGLSSDEDEIVTDRQKERTLATQQVSITPLGDTVESRQGTAQTNAEEDKMKMVEIEDQLQYSSVKQRHWEEKIAMLEMEKARIEEQTSLLQKEKDHQSDQWKNKVNAMQEEHSKVINNLSNVNNSYKQQVEENEKLKQQLELMQKQHSEMMSRFESIEARLNSEQRQREQTPDKNLQNSLSMSHSKKDMIVSVKKLQRIEDTFGSTNDDQLQSMIQKIQTLLLNVERNVDEQLAQPLIIHYTKQKAFNGRLQMINALGDALDENEDVLVALSSDVYKALLNFLLWAFAHEKQILEDSQLNDQNQVTMLSQQMVSKLLNSKRFTTSLVALFQLLREAMPDDLEVDLSVEERQYLRVVMRCIQRISKALQSEQPDMVRAFDVLIEMQKMFIRHPPEQLREDLPCLSDFDYIYRAMKDVSDKLIELQPDKVESFLSYAAEQPQNAFIKYLKQMIETVDAGRR